MLAAAIQAEILRLTFAEHWSVSRIARHLGVQLEERAQGRAAPQRRPRAGPPPAADDAGHAVHCPASRRCSRRTRSARR